MAAKALYLIFNHLLTAEQEESARRTLAVERMVPLPPELADLWRHVPPELPSLRTYLAPIIAWIRNRAVPGDCILIQGDFGACYLMVRAAFEMGLVPVYATTLRTVSEKPRPDGSIEMTRRFRHEIFRRYGE